MPFQRGLSKGKTKAGKMKGEISVQWPQRRHYHGDYDLLEKERLSARKFGYLRHQVYGDIIKPLPGSLSYFPEEERLSTDIDGLLKKEEQKMKERKRVALEFHKAEHAYRDYQTFSEREKDWKKSVEKDEYRRNVLPHARVVSNKTSVPYNLITLQYNDCYEGAHARYKDEAKRWRASMRAIRIHEKTNGDLKYNVISWTKRDPLFLPEKPTPPPLPALNKDFVNRVDAKIESL